MSDMVWHDVRSLGRLLTAQRRSYIGAGPLSVGDELVPAGGHVRMFRRSVVASIAAIVLLLSLTVGAATAARPVFVFQTLMTGEAEVPGPGDPDAIGHATVMIRPSTNEVCWVLSWNRIDGTVVAAHIHGPADEETAVAPIVTFFMGIPHEGTDTDRGCTVSEAWADAIVAEPSQFYVNVHSLPDHGPGAIRGQLGS